MRHAILVAAYAILVCAFVTPSLAQDDAVAARQAPIELADTSPTDNQITDRIAEIFQQIDELNGVNVEAQAGVVTLTGETANADAAERAVQLASRVTGVVTVENEIARNVSVVTRVAPLGEQLEGYIYETIRILPLVALSALVFAVTVACGWLVAGWTALWRRTTPNAFVAELLGSAIRVTFLVLATIITLNLLDATTVLGAFLGAAGVIALAVGFAVRDTIENYVSSIMLSLRQPFKPNDHVSINEHEGYVIRLTSRSTILMTPQGNHLRLPNAMVFKAVILNYSSNPERRFEFSLGVDADDDPIAASNIGLNAMSALPFVLKDPPPLAYVQEVGDSNIIIFFGAWIDQRTADFFKSRSLALSAAKDALEDAGFALPEPIYRIRFDADSPPLLKEADRVPAVENAIKAGSDELKQKRQKHTGAAMNVAPETHIEEKIEEERRENADEDLLKESAPTE